MTSSTNPTRKWKS